MPVALMDVLAAHQMRSAALLALWQRERDGLGSYLEVWLDASGLSALANRATEYLVAGHEPAALGALHPQIAPYGETFWCRCGGQIVTAVGMTLNFRPCATCYTVLSGGKTSGSLPTLRGCNTVQFWPS